MGQLGGESVGADAAPRAEQPPADATSAKPAKSEPPAPQPTEDPLESALKTPCPITKYEGKTLGDMITLDPKALVWVSEKFTGDPTVAAAAKLICEHSLAA
jgi:hypothetical protein